MSSEEFYKNLDKIVNESLPSYKIKSVDTSYLIFEGVYKITIQLEKEE